MRSCFHAFMLVCLHVITDHGKSCQTMPNHAFITYLILVMLYVALCCVVLCCVVGVVVVGVVFVGVVVGVCCVVSRSAPLTLSPSPRSPPTRLHHEHQHQHQHQHRQPHRHPSIHPSTHPSSIHGWMDGWIDGWILCESVSVLVQVLGVGSVGSVDSLSRTLTEGEGEGERWRHRTPF